MPSYNTRIYVSSVILAHRQFNLLQPKAAVLGMYKTSVSSNYNLQSTRVLQCGLWSLVYIELHGRWVNGFDMYLMTVHIKSLQKLKFKDIHVK
jgi:hypothetical protein